MASISLTICPFAIPPIAGLQLICAMVCIFMVTNNTFDPIFAAAAAASQPAWPAPTTIMSYSLVNLIYVKVKFLFILYLSYLVSLIIKAISLRPINTEDYLYRALSKQRLKDYTGALNDFTKAIELNPKNLIAYNNRAYKKIILKDLSGACEDWKKFEDLGGIVDEENKNEFCK